MTDKTAVERMMVLFEGFSGAHGTHASMTQSASKGGKMEIKKTARTVREPVTPDLWQAHLDGSQALGIIPIREDGMCLWGCIDIDQYDINLGQVVQDLKKRQLPLIVCRTKSGGAHVFLFLREAAPAEQLRARLRQISASMGWGESEIFPKQNQILSERGDLGNWLNMPYLAAATTVRYGVKESGSGMTISEFLTTAEEARTVLDSVSDSNKAQDESLDDGPPCLQHLATVGFPEGTRNNGLFGLGIFCRKKFGGRWKDMLEAYNRTYMEPPLPADEVQRVITSLEKKDYQYRCKDQPMVSYCNSTLCKMRKFGVGGAGKYPTISGMSKLDAGSDTLWFLDIEDSRVELTTRQLQNYREFQAVCMDLITVFFLPMKSETWAAMVSEAMANATIIEASPEITALGHFMELLDDFCMNSFRGRTQDDLLLGKPWQDEKTGQHYFRLKDLMEFLERRKFDKWGRNVVGRRLEEIGGKTFFNIKGKGVNVYFVKDVFQKTGETQLPPSREAPV